MLVALVLWCGFVRTAAFGKPGAPEAEYISVSRRVVVHKDLSSTVIHEETIRVHTQAAAQNFRTITFSLHPKAHVTVEDARYGADVPMTKRGKVLTHKPLAGAPARLSITFRDLAPGDSLTYRLRIVQPPLGQGQFATVGVLSKRFQVREATFEVQAPAGLGLFAGREPMGSQGLKPIVRAAWKATNLKPIVRAAWKATNLKPGESPQCIVVTTFRNWQDVATWYRAAYWAEDKSVTELAIRILADSGAKSVSEKAKAAFDYVAALETQVFSVGGDLYKPAAPGATLRAGGGDCKDKAALLTGLLTALGVRCSPVMLLPNTRELKQTVPKVQGFVHAAVYVSELGTLFDPAKRETRKVADMNNALAIERTAPDVKVRGEVTKLQPLGR